MKKKIFVLIFSITFLNSIIAETGIYKSSIIINSTSYDSSAFENKNLGLFTTTNTLILNGSDIRIILIIGIAMSWLLFLQELYILLRH